MLLAGVGVGKEEVSRLAEQHGWGLEGPPSAPRIVLLGEDHLGEVAAWLRLPTVALVERRTPVVVPPTADLSICVRTDTAWTINLAGMVCDEMEARGWIPDDMAYRLKTAVYEALANAVVHGNLAVASVPDMDVDGFFRLNEMLEARLKEETYAGRPLRVEITVNDKATIVAVEDAGDGFEMENGLMDRTAQAIEPRGRHGLDLIQVCAGTLLLEKGGRRVVMRFERDAE